MMSTARVVANGLRSNARSFANKSEKIVFSKRLKDCLEGIPEPLKLEPVTKVQSTPKFNPRMFETPYEERNTPRFNDSSVEAEDRDAFLKNADPVFDTIYAANNHY